MKYNHYLEDILGSKAKIKLLRTIYKFRDKKWTIRELANFNRMNHFGVIYALRSLQDMNLINVEYHGKSNLVTLNYKSILVRLLRIFDFENNSRKELIKDIKNLLNNKVISCILFGSIARSEERPNSDIDLLIITKNKKLVKNIIYEKLKYFSESYGNIIIPKIFSEREFIKKKSLPFIKSIGTNYIIISGKDVLK